jgi:hypothetical protein
MIKRMVWVVFLSLGALALVATPSYADSIGGPGSTCGTCQGATYTLQQSVESSSGGNTTYDITYTIDTSTYTGGGAFLDAAAVKVSSSVTPLTTTLDAAPGGIANWSVIDGGISAAGCDGSGSGFECANDSTEPGAAVGGTLVWVFDITIPTGSLITTPLGASIKARYVDALDNKVGDLVSEDINLQTGGGSPPPPPVPEPASLMLLGSGLLALSSKRIFRKA